MTTMTAEAVENLMLRVTQEIRVRASLDRVDTSGIEKLPPHG